MFAMHDSRGVFYLSGELDMESAEQFQRFIGSGLEGTGELVLDLADVCFIDSMGVRTLALLSHRVGGGLVLRYPQDAVSRVLEMLQFDEIPGVRIVHDSATRTDPGLMRCRSTAKVARSGPAASRMSARTLASRPRCAGPP